MLYSAMGKSQGEGFHLKKSYIRYGEVLQACIICRQDTYFQDENIGNLPVCSEECNNQVWEAYDRDMNNLMFQNHMATYKQEIIEELKDLQFCKNRSKDILIIVHDQLDYLKKTIDSIIEYTSNYHIYIWDNCSQKPTQDYLHELMYRLNGQITVISSATNLGFIEPNNELAALGNSDYIILLNSDTTVMGGWDKALLAHLQSFPSCKLVGYQGGLLDAQGMGGRIGFGKHIDYVAGWCLCLERSTYEQYGLFDSSLKFAYAEDSDLSLRIQNAGHEIYALHLLLVHHFENKTIFAVRDEGEIDVYATFAHNHEILRERWTNYLATQRIDVRQQNQGNDALDAILSKLV